MSRPPATARPMWSASARVLVLVVLGGTSLTAQTAGPVGTRVYDVALGAVVLGPMVLGDGSADLTRPDGRPLPLFTTDVSFGSGLGIEAHFGRRIGTRWLAEVTGTWIATEIRTRISGDFENAPAVTVTEDVSRLSLEGSALWTMAGGAGSSVFLRAGAGWMRELAGAGTLAEDGIVGNVGVGMKYWWRRTPPGRGRQWGLRMDGRAVLRSRGVDLGAETVRVAPAVSADLMFGF